MKNVLLITLFLLMAGCRTAPDRPASRGADVIDNLPRDVLMTLWETDRDHVRGVLGRPNKQYPSEGGEAWEYEGEFMLLLLVFHEPGTVQTMTYSISPAYESRLKREQAEAAKKRR